MSTKATLTLQGLEKWMADINQAIVDIDDAASQALLAGAQLVHKEMVANAPGPKTHDLENHIVIDGPHREGNYTFVQIGVIPGAGTSGATMRKAVAEEFGWTSGGKRHPGKSYIRAGWDASIDRARAAMRAKLKELGHL